jgi:hypothetical protein
VSAAYGTEGDPAWGISLVDILENVQGGVELVIVCCCVFSLLWLVLMRLQVFTQFSVALGRQTQNAKRRHTRAFVSRSSSKMMNTKARLKKLNTEVLVLL